MYSNGLKSFELVYQYKNHTDTNRIIKKKTKPPRLNLNDKGNLLPFIIFLCFVCGLCEGFTDRPPSLLTFILL